MKVAIGEYLTWWGPYQIADLLQKVGVSEDRCYRIGQYLANTWVGTFCQWVHDKRKRKVKVHIDRYDVWNMANTLALVILPMLLELDRQRSGYPLVDDEDAPEMTRSTAAPPIDEYGNWDDNANKRWDWVMSEMIWTFRQLQPDCDWESLYHSGNIDHIWVKDEETPPNCSRLEHGPNHTHSFDMEGYKKHNDRIQNGLRLFGKYYQSLWD